MTDSNKNNIEPKPKQLPSNAPLAAFSLFLTFAVLIWLISLSKR